MQSLQALLSAEGNSQFSKALKILNDRDPNIVSIKFGANLKNQEIAQILDIFTVENAKVLYTVLNCSFWNIIFQKKKSYLDF